GCSGGYLVRRNAARGRGEPGVPCCWPGAASSGVGYDANVSNIRVIMEIDPLSPVPLHEQVAAALRRAIAQGEAKPGERLPPARGLAAVLGGNANTALRAVGGVGARRVGGVRRG